LPVDARLCIVGPPRPDGPALEDPDDAVRLLRRDPRLTETLDRMERFAETVR